MKGFIQLGPVSVPFDIPFGTFVAGSVQGFLQCGNPSALLGRIIEGMKDHCIYPNSNEHILPYIEDLEKLREVWLKREEKKT